MVFLTFLGYSKDQKIRESYKKLFHERQDKTNPQFRGLDSLKSLRAHLCLCMRSNRFLFFEMNYCITLIDFVHCQSMTETGFFFSESPFYYLNRKKTIQKAFSVLRIFQINLNNNPIL